MKSRFLLLVLAALLVATSVSAGTVSAVPNATIAIVSDATIANYLVETKINIQEEVGDIMSAPVAENMTVPSVNLAKAQSFETYVAFQANHELIYMSTIPQEAATFF